MLKKVFYVNSLILAFAILGVCSTLDAGRLCELLISPTDRITQRLIAEINASTKEILAAIYYLSDKTIAQALVNARDRGCRVEIISDASTSESPYSKIPWLTQQKVKTFIPQPPPARSEEKTSDAPITRFGVRGGIMHHKFALMDGTKVFTGSFNWTVSANFFNQENYLIITGDSVLYQQYYGVFMNLQRRCMPYPLTSCTRMHQIIRHAQAVSSDRALYQSAS